MIRIGVIGYGYFGPNIARCVAEANGTVLTAIADPSPAAQARAATRHPGVRIDDDWHRMLADPEIDAVAIATPTRLHYEIALAALMAGKHVLVEKPITPTSREAARLVAEAAKRRLTLMVDHTFVYTGAVQKIRDLIDTGVTGDLFYYDSTRINFGLFQDDVNVIWDLAVHDLAILDFLLPAETLAISATGAGHIKGSPENLAHITLYLEGGITAHLNVNWLAPVKIRRTLIGGSRRMIVFDDMEPSEKVKVYDRGVEFHERPSQEEIRRILPAYRMGDVWTPHIPVKEALITEIEHFAHCVTHNQVPLTSGESGLRVVRLLEAASQSLAQRGHPIDLSPLRAA
ncbi:Gfo/Idh/MocA family oxidoreductase [Methylobacterium terricola]|uniref:Gfo/Idh/MocA family oxidoreductase n=1 Tax=Methylobacterium terricola TaxID=2583531 RepID=A0A5C4LCM3_9HYPH|nr:Gfo/Idh/MocA family oxidoreductase [Methylobacterium terricola]TNC10238.1 Gfo/Idh/MocA family oxidoreductase [Methylobacterium terricola]